MSAFPLLFCLSLEPLAQAIRKSEVSIKIHDHNHSISLYADDIILYLDHFDVSVSSIINKYKINKTFPLSFSPSLASLYLFEQ